MFTRDLRINDNPALSAAVGSAGRVVPLFVLDDALLRSRVSAPPNRQAFLAGSLRDLHDSLRSRGAGLLLRRGEWVREVVRLVAEVGATTVHVADDVTPVGRRRLGELRAALATTGVGLENHVGLTVVPPGEVVPLGRESYSVFTPYWRAWVAHPWRATLPTPASITLPPQIEAELARRMALLDELDVAALPIPAGETAGRARVTAWRVARVAGLAGYETNHDNLAAAATSGLSAYLHVGCLSPLELAVQLRDQPGGGPFVRQLAWRDFFHQIVAAHPGVVWRDHRSMAGARAPAEPGREEEFWAAWTQGRTGYPLVDAAMRQLDAEGFVHNRARMVAASFLTNDLGLPWQRGARQYLTKLIDGDLVVNNMNWQWVAGTGTDTNRRRVLSPLRHAERFDRAAVYIRRYLPELAGLPGALARNPDDAVRRATGYPLPVVESASTRRH